MTTEHTDLRLRVEQELVSHGPASYHPRKEQGIKAERLSTWGGGRGPNAKKPGMSWQRRLEKQEKSGE